MMKSIEAVVFNWVCHMMRPKGPVPPMPEEHPLPALWWRNKGTHWDLTDGDRTYGTVDQMNNPVLTEIVYFGFIGDQIGNMFLTRQEAQDWVITEVRHLLLQELEA